MSIGEGEESFDKVYWRVVGGDVGIAPYKFYGELQKAHPYGHAFVLICYNTPRTSPVTKP